VNIVSTVTGEKSDNPGLLLLKPGVTAAELGKAVGSLPNNSPFDAIDPYASIVFDGNATERDSDHGADLAGARKLRCDQQRQRLHAVHRHQVG